MTSTDPTGPSTSTGLTGPGAPAFVSGPSGLSDQAVSPLGMPLTLLREEVRVAFVGRTSTEDHQDPRQSIMRQRGNVDSAIPKAWVVVAHFYDVESGRLELAERGQRGGYERFDIPIPRAGGIADLLAEAGHPGCRFDVVVCESVSRVARRTFEGLSIERALDDAGVPLMPANEPMSLSGSRAQRILQRRINQSVAEYEVLNTLEQSWGGLCTHTREGWNIGKPPDGYRAVELRHPNPTKAAKGQTKTRLEPDGLRAQTVTLIAHWRYHDALGYGAIADRLNADPTAYPPPTATSTARTRGSWSRSAIQQLLANPKYSGYQIFNRRARRSRSGAHNDPRKWVWSTQPAHEPLIAKWLYDELVARRATQDRRGKNTEPHPTGTRTYLLRGLVVCHCGRRMNGEKRQRNAYYKCWPKGNNRGRPDLGHPKPVYLPEAALLDAVSRFYAERVLGPDRRALLAADLASRDTDAADAARTERSRLERLDADLERRQASVLRQAQDGTPDDPFTRGLRATYNTLDAQRRDTADQLAALNAEQPEPEATNPELLDALPHLRLNLTQAPDHLLRQLFQLTQLKISLTEHPDRDDIHLAVRIPAGRLHAVADTLSVLADDHTTETAQQGRSSSPDPLGVLSVPPVGLEPTPRRF